MKPSLTIRWDAERRTEVYIQSGITARAGELAATVLGATTAVVLADSRLKAPAGRLSASLKRAGWDVQTLTFPATEALKDYRKAFPVFGRLLKHSMDRHSVVFAIGGGVIGDFAGFIAGTYLRGIRWVGVPTTLLAQVDSCLGGKTGVNHPLGKNLIGVFHQPSLILCDPLLLKTLSARDRISGIGEMLKYGIAYDPAYYRYLIQNQEAILRIDPKIAPAAVERALKWKARIARDDERETRGLRYTLNFGHTLAHALEVATHYRHYRHGEAVIAGMRLATALSVVRGHLKPEIFKRIDEDLAGLPVPERPRVSVSTIWRYAQRDKKARAGKIAFVLLRQLGKTVRDTQVREADVQEAFQL